MKGGSWDRSALELRQRDGQGHGKGYRLPTQPCLAIALRGIFSRATQHLSTCVYWKDRDARPTRQNQVQTQTSQANAGGMEAYSTCPDSHRIHTDRFLSKDSFSCSKYVSRKAAQPCPEAVGPRGPISAWACRPHAGSAGPKVSCRAPGSRNPQAKTRESCTSGPRDEQIYWVVTNAK